MMHVSSVPFRLACSCKLEQKQIVSSCYAFSNVGGLWAINTMAVWPAARAELAKHQPPAPKKWKLLPRRIKPQKPLLSAAHRLIRNIFSLQWAVGFMDGFIYRAHRRKLIILQMSSDEMKISLGICCRSIAGLIEACLHASCAALFQRNTRIHESQIDLFAFPGVIRRILISRFFVVEAIISNTRIIHPQTSYTCSKLDSSISLRDGLIFILFRHHALWILKTFNEGTLGWNW